MPHCLTAAESSSQCHYLLMLLLLLFRDYDKFEGWSDSRSDRLSSDMSSPPLGDFPASRRLLESCPDRRISNTHTPVSLQAQHGCAPLPTQPRPRPPPGPAKIPRSAAARVCGAVKSALGRGSGGSGRVSVTPSWGKRGSLPPCCSLLPLSLPPRPLPSPWYSGRRNCCPASPPRGPSIGAARQRSLLAPALRRSAAAAFACCSQLPYYAVHSAVPSCCPLYSRAVAPLPTRRANAAPASALLPPRRPPRSLRRSPCASRRVLCPAAGHGSHSGSAQCTARAPAKSEPGRVPLQV